VQHGTATVRERPLAIEQLCLARSLKILHLALVFLSRFASLKRAQILPLSRRVLLAGVEPVLAALEFPNHTGFKSKRRTGSDRDWLRTGRADHFDVGYLDAFPGGLTGGRATRLLTSIFSGHRDFMSDVLGHVYTP